MILPVLPFLFLPVSVPAGIPVEEEEEEEDTSIKGRLLAMLYKIKGPPKKLEEEPTEEEQAAPSKILSLCVNQDNTLT